MKRALGIILSGLLAASSPVIAKNFTSGAAAPTTQVKSRYKLISVDYKPETGQTHLRFQGQETSIQDFVFPSQYPHAFLIVGSTYPMTVFFQAGRVLQVFIELPQTGKGVWMVSGNEKIEVSKMRFFEQNVEPYLLL